MLGEQVDLFKEAVSAKDEVVVQLTNKVSNIPWNAQSVTYCVMYLYTWDIALEMAEKHTYLRKCRQFVLGLFFFSAYDTHIFKQLFEQMMASIVPWSYFQLRTQNWVLVFSMYQCYNLRGTLSSVINWLLTILGECRTLWGERERAVTKSNLSSYSG